jgi:hypothetical protein
MGETFHIPHTGPLGQLTRAQMNTSQSGLLWFRNLVWTMRQIGRLAIYAAQISKGHETHHKSLVLTCVS